jgi:signal-transduction protein with cAMP-binding, CBS, and nucleotidyltransferase domain
MITLTAEEIARHRQEEILFVPPETTVYDSVKLILEKKGTAVLVREKEKVTGIWTERDLLRDVTLVGFDLKTAKIGDYMSSPVISAPHSATVFQLIDKFLGLSVRHLMIERDGEFIGLLYVREVIRAALTERTIEFEELNKMVSWEYYEDWKWKKKHP